MPIVLALCPDCGHVTEADRLPDRCFRCGGCDVHALRSEADAAGVSFALEERGDADSVDE